VGVGSFSDPPDAQGLAHFLEHMLFMGSSEFPDENEYDTFLSKHGGGSNAFTETEFTCYHFDISPSFLKPALDRFSQFFISPLAKAEAMDREVQAIDSEFEQVLQSDACRLLQLQCHTAKPSHPFNTFSWGNVFSFGLQFLKCGK
jgi:nardilysin